MQAWFAYLVLKVGPGSFGVRAPGNHRRGMQLIGSLPIPSIARELKVDLPKLILEVSLAIALVENGNLLDLFGHLLGFRLVFAKTS